MARARRWQAAAAMVALALLAGSPFGAAPTGAASAPADLMQRLRATYGELRSYADSGAVLYEYGGSAQDHHTFTTAFTRAPRRFQLDFHKDGGDRHVLWGDPDAFHTWTKAVGAQTDYPNPNNVGAITLSGPNTASVAAKIPTLLYAKAEIPGDFSNLRDLAAAGSEAVDGHRCERYTARAVDVYGTGREVNAHAMAMWIDAETQLIRKVVEEWPPIGGHASRRTTTYRPEANLALDESRFRFDPKR